VHVPFQYSSDFVKKQEGCRRTTVVRGSKAMGGYTFLICPKLPPCLPFKKTKVGG
jgi:hypothetical protein